MEKRPQDQNLADAPDDQNLNANSAYSGSGTMQPGGGVGKEGRLSDFPDGNLNENLHKTDSVTGSLADKPSRNNVDEANKPQGGRTFEESMDPDKLADI